MAMKSLSIIGEKGPTPGTDEFSAALRVENGSARRQESVFGAVEHEVLVTMVL